ncbi:phosphatase PAP2 family protein [Acrocarpospora corrugata]|uniref:Phosphatase PAP2 family protein n=1 Tax=Acrocarpospora corrugata TaxID=35763 RepID=A0A5M3VY03_9ACTN|nr:phosphatase PAP2 family protein [Acrocarpospora corrugata]GES00969.1 phosphatase PAP2 family protein [Acrocarpospora corrugata]
MQVRLLVGLASLAFVTLLGFASRSPEWTARDAAAGRAIQSVRTPWLTVAARVLDIGFSTLAGVIIVFVLVVTLALTGRAAAAWRSLAVILAGWGAGMLLKILVTRPRPPAARALISQLGDTSFPSGHVCLTLSIMIAVALLIRRPYAVVIGALVVVAQMFARIYLGVHYPTDTVGSLIAAPAAIALVLGATANRALAGRSSAAR